MKILRKLKDQCLNVLEAVGNFINQTPERTPKKKPRIEQPWQAKKSGIDYHEKTVGKGSSKKKGNVNAGTTTFNHPRRELDQFQKN